MQRLLLFTIFILCSSLVYGQSTYEQLYNVMQEKCTGCHGGDSPQGSLDLSGDMNVVYDILVGANPVNPSAMSKGYKRVKPGYVEQSYLLHKLATEEWDNTFGLETADGDAMPPSPLPQLSKKEIELFRQWVMFGAPMNGEVIDPQILEDYYENGMNLPTTASIAPPDPSEGYQLRLGPFFLEPLEEREYFLKKDLEIANGYEVNKLDVKFNAESHHFIMYQMPPNIANNYPNGLRDVGNSQNAMFNNTLVSVWQNEGEYVLPEYSAYKFNPGTYADLNYHLKNYSATGILAANVYLNIYTQPDGTALEEMKSVLIPINIFEMFFGAPLGNGLEIPNDGEEHVFTDHLWVPDLPGAPLPFPAGTWHIWQLSTHTHARGIDYDIFIGQNSGEKGEQIYEGFYNFDYTFDQGFYDWEHPPIKYFDPLLPIDMSVEQGLVHEATYVNNTAGDLAWGDTTDEEMMLLFVHFTEGALPVSVKDIDLSTTNEFKSYPNPYQMETIISFDLDKASNVRLEVFNMLGELVTTLVDGEQQSGTQQFSFSAKALGLSNGMYMAKLNIDGQESTLKMIEMN